MRRTVANAQPFVVAGIAIAALSAAALAVSPKRSTWGPAVPELDMNNSVLGGCPIESRDGLSLYTASARPNGHGGLDIWANDRPSIGAAFGPAMNLPAPVNSEYNDFCPTRFNGNYLLFVSERPGGCDPANVTGDMYIIRRNPALGWGEPVNLGCAESGEGPNTAGAEFSPSVIETEAGTFLYYSSTGSGNHDIYMSRMESDGTFGPGLPVFGLNTEADDRMPNVSKDGLEIVFSSDREFWGGGEPSAGSFDVYSSTRAHLNAPWSDPINLSVLSNFSTKETSETRASLSWDGQRLRYGADGEIYVSERLPLPGRGRR